MKLTRISVVSLLVVVVLLATAFTGSAAPAPNAYPQGSLQPQTAYDVHHDTSPALSSIAPKPDQTHVEKDPPFFHRLPGGFEGEPDSMVQRDAAPNAMPAPIANFEGLGNHFGGWPPDTQGEVVEIDLSDRPAWLYEKNAAGRVPVLKIMAAPPALGCRLPPSSPTWSAIRTSGCLRASPIGTGYGLPTPAGTRPTLAAQPPRR